MDQLVPIFVIGRGILARQSSNESMDTIEKMAGVCSTLTPPDWTAAAPRHALMPAVPMVCSQISERTWACSG